MSSIEDRLTKLEADSHPPIDLTLAMDELLDARGYVPAALVAKLLGEPDDDMLNAAQERLCQISSRTNFNDHEQAEMFKAMVAEAIAACIKT